MTEEEKDLLIEKYLRRELSLEDTSLVDSLRKTDAAFNEDFKTQKIIRDTLKYGQIKENLSRIIAENSLNEPKKAGKVRIMRPWMAIAASIVLLMGFVGYAFQKLGWVNFEKLWKKEKSIQIEKHNDTPSIDSLFQREENIMPLDTVEQNNEYEVISSKKSNTSVNNAIGIEFEAIEQNIFIKTDEFTRIATGSGIAFSFPENALTNNSNSNLDSIEISYSEIIKTDGFKIGNTKNKVIKVFKLIYANEKDWQLNKNTPLSFALESKDKNYVVYFGGNNKELTNWEIHQSFGDDFIKTPTKVMADYQAYRESIKLIDSVRNYYSREDDYFISKSDKKLKLNAEFVFNRYGYIQAYQNDKAFSYKVNLATKSWEIYNAQRSITVNTDSQYNVPNQNFINKPGWYAIVEGD